MPSEIGKEALKPVIRFAGFTDAWEQRKLKDIAKEVKRRCASSSAPIMMISATSGFIPQSEKYATNNAGKSLEKYILLEKNELAYNHGASKLRPFGSCFALSLKEARIPFVYHCFSIEQSDPRFASIQLNSDAMQRQLRGLVSSGARMDGLLNISFNEYASVKMFLPSLEEQRQITFLLDKCEQTFVLHQRKLEGLQKLKKALLQKMFPSEGEDRPAIRFAGFTDAWEQRKLGNLFLQGGSGGTPLASNPAFYNGTIPFLTISDVKDRFITKTKKTITEMGLQSSSAWIVPKGTISLAMYASVGIVGICSIDTATSQAFFNMVFDSTHLRDFVFTRLEKAFQEKEWESSISTGTQRNLNANKVKTFKMMIPSEPEIASVSSFFLKLDESIVLHQRKLEQLQKLKKSLLQKMFI